MLQKTPLYALQQAHGATFVPFAGYTLPVHYPLGVKQEHWHTRHRAGLFDVSHMGQLRLTGANVAAELEKLIPVDLQGLAIGRQRYGLFTNTAGGIIDDLIISRLPATKTGEECFYLVVNAAGKAQDIDHLKAHLPDAITLEVQTDRALLALQGPQAAAVMAGLVPVSESMVFMDCCCVTIAGIDCYLSRAGYTGEDGFEISVPAAQAITLAKQLLAQPGVDWIGLGARDSLRLEAGLCLYGQDITTTTTPVEAGLTWAISPVRRLGRERAGGFPGAAQVLAQIQAPAAIAQQRIGLIGTSRAPVRSGAVLTDADGQPIGQVTSGTFSPTLAKPIAMGYCPPEAAALGATVYAQVRGKSLAMTVCQLPFVTPRYYRG